MKKFLFYLSLASFLFLNSLFFVPFSQAATTEEIIISAPTHRLLTGKFIDEGLGEQLKPDGKLGQIFYLSAKSKSKFLIDMSTIEEISDLSDGYQLMDESVGKYEQIAKNWLARFNQVANSKNSFSIIYGNPSKTWIDKLFPSEFEYYKSVNKLRLEEYLGGSVTYKPFDDGKYDKNDKDISLPKEAITSFTSADTQLKLLSTIVDPKELSIPRLRLAQLLNADIEPRNISMFYADFNKSMSDTRKKLRITTTKFTVTNENQKLPITLVNEFASNLKIKMLVKPTNLKVGVRSIDDIEVEANSKKQILLPIDVFASGSSALQVQLTDLQGNPLGFPAYVSLNLSVISSATAWLTTIAALLLLIGVIAQSVRRFKSNKQEELSIEN
ncbi:MAG: hypothetical protein RLZZ378_630 [Actinomycetota bacterium]